MEPVAATNRPNVPTNSEINIIRLEFFMNLKPSSWKQFVVF
jgi:hypothetical protein